MPRLPVRDVRFWLVQAMVVGLAAAHLTVDMLSAPSSVVPAGIPVALLLAPVSYAALRYGLSGSVATAVWAVVLWLPDLLLPSDQGHAGNDVIELALVVAVAVFVGEHIDAERRERAEREVAQARYLQLFDTNAAPILVAGQSGEVVDANPAAQALVAGGVIGRHVQDLLGFAPDPAGEGAVRVIEIATHSGGRRDFRVTAARVPTGPGQHPLTQLVLEDVTEERAEGLRVQRFVELLLGVQEDERRRIARGLHDEPLQLLIHLARSLEGLATTAQTPDTLATGLAGARRQTLDIASRLRSVVAGLRPPALEQLGLVAALRGFLADLGESVPVRADMEIVGAQQRLDSEIELAAFRIAQEAVNNVIRHAHATRVLITLDFGDGGGLCLKVADDGRGFDPSAADGQTQAGRFGLLGMRERAVLVGGQVAVKSAPGQGTTVEAMFPAPAQQAEPPAQHVAPPAQQAESPAQHVAPPAQHVAPPAQQAEPPAQQAEPPAQRA